MEPVDPAEAPDYYKVIKEPMGKDTKWIFFLQTLGLNVPTFNPTHEFSFNI